MIGCTAGQLRDRLRPGALIAASGRESIRLADGNPPIARGGLARRDRTGVGPHRLHQLRRIAGAHRVLRELCVERRGWLTETEFERALAAVNLPRPCLHPAGDLLRLAPARHGRSACGRTRLHPAGPHHDPCALGAVPVRLPSGLVAWGGHGSRRGGRGRRGARRSPVAALIWRRAQGGGGARARIRAARWDRGSSHRSVAGARAVRLRRDRACPHTASPAAWRASGSSAAAWPGLGQARGRPSADALDAGPRSRRAPTRAVRVRWFDGVQGRRARLRWRSIVLLDADFYAVSTYQIG